MMKNLIVAPIAVNLMKNLIAVTVKIDYAKGTVKAVKWNLDTPNATVKTPEIAPYAWPVNAQWCKDKANAIRYWIWNGSVIKAQNQKAFGWIDEDDLSALYTKAWRKGLGVNHQKHKRNAVRLWERYRNRHTVTVLHRKGKPLSMFDGYWNNFYNGKFFGARKFLEQNPLTA